MTDLAGKKSYTLDHSEAKPGFDASRIHVKGVVYFTIGFVLTMAGILLSLWYFEAGVQGRPRPTDLAHPRESRPLPQPLQPSPDHPTLPWQDMQALRQAQEERLNSAGPNADPAGTFHIPIDKAIDRLLDSGTLNQPWQNPSTQPYTRPPNETPQSPSVENRT
jgi:hypothetical protein